MGPVGTVVVTGATGFVGRVLCVKLKTRGVQVHGLARNATDGPWERLICADISAGPLPDDALRGVEIGRAHV